MHFLTEDAYIGKEYLARLMVNKTENQLPLLLAINCIVSFSPECFIRVGAWLGEYEIMTSLNRADITSP